MVDSQQDIANVPSALPGGGANVAVRTPTLDDLGDSKREGDPLGLSHLLDVPVRVTVEVGRARLTLAELVDLGPGSLVTLDREAHEPCDILVNGKVVARGEIVTIDGQYGVRISSVSRA